MPNSSNGSGDEDLATRDVISALFPVHDPGGHEQEGYRPAVIVGQPERVGTPRFSLFIIAPMTTYRAQEWAEQAPGLYPRFEKGTANLRAPSICLLDQVRALGPERVRGYRGTLGEEEYRPIREGLQRMLGDLADEEDTGQG